MRFKESLALDYLIDERRASLLLKHNKLDIDKRAQALTVLIAARDELDRIANIQEPEYVRKHIKFSGTAEDGRRIKSRKRRDLRHLNLQAVPAVTNIGDIHVNVGRVPNADFTGREIAKALRTELRRGGESGREL